MRRTPSDERGSTLIELVLTLAVIAVIASIAYPVYMATFDRGAAAAARSDAAHIAGDLMGELATYFSFGTQHGTIAVHPSNKLILSPMAAASPYATGPGLTSLDVTLSPGSVLTAGTYGAGAGTHWCIAVTNDGETAVATEKGIQDGATGCNVDGTAIGGAQ